MDKIKRNKGLIIKLSVILAIALILFILISIYKQPIAEWLVGKDGTSGVYRDLELSGREWLFWLVIVLAQVGQAVFLQISNSLVTAPLGVIVGICNPQSVWGLDVEFGLKAFLFSWLGIAIGNIILYCIGRFAGEKIVKFFVGKDENKLNKLKKFMKAGKEFYLIGCCDPLIPSDVLNLLSGYSRYNPIFVIVSTILTRGICCLCTFCIFFGLTTYYWKFGILAALIVLMIVITWWSTKKAINGVKENE